MCHATMLQSDTYHENDVVEKNIDSSSKSNLMCRRQKIRRVDVKTAASTSKKYLKSRRTFNKSFCDLFTAITYIKITIACLIISYKYWKQNNSSKTVDDLALDPIETWLKEKLTWTSKKKKHIKKWLKIPTHRRKIRSRNRKNKVRRRRNVVEKSQSEFDSIDVRLYI